MVGCFRGRQVVVTHEGERGFKPCFRLATDWDTWPKYYFFWFLKLYISTMATVTTAGVMFMVGAI